MKKNSIPESEFIKAISRFQLLSLATKEMRILIFLFTTVSRTVTCVALECFDILVNWL
jgi:hypothetical protein